jgi:hypothetical protein
MAYRTSPPAGGERLSAAIGTGNGDAFAGFIPGGGVWEGTVMGERGDAPLRVMTSESSWTCSRDYAGQPDQVGEARTFLTLVLDGCPVAEDAVLLMAEVAANAVLHSASRRPGGRFTVRADASEGEYLRVEVSDQGGPWQPKDARTDGRGHGLDIVTALADDWGRHGDPATGWTVWFRLGWPAAAGGALSPQVPLPAPGERHGHPAACPGSRGSRANVPRRSRSHLIT